MSIIIQFLHFRLKQMGRSIAEIGIPLLIIFLIVTIGITFKILQFLTEVETDIIGTISFFIIAGIHFSRKDESFLNRLNTSKVGLLFCEYNMLMIPVSVLLFFLGKIEVALFWQVGWLPVLFFPVGFLKKRNAVSFFSFEIIPNKYFEIKAGFRKSFFAIALVYLIALSCSFFNGTLILFSIFILLLMPIFFEFFEPKEIISNQYQRRGFLKAKIIQHVFHFQIFILPHYLLFFFFHIEFWYLGVASFVAIGLMVVFCVVYKYASYRPASPKHFGNTFHALFFGTLIMPGFVIVSIVLIVHFWRKAKKNLAYYYA